jgi:transcriptional regulator with XRE-family HTH domain
LTVATGATAAEQVGSGVLVVLGIPPVGAVDHVDLGDGTSERAHRLSASATSGTNMEAGLTRRYTQQAVAGGYFEFDLAVTPGQPFVLRAALTPSAKPSSQGYGWRRVGGYGDGMSDVAYIGPGGRGRRPRQLLRTLVGDVLRRNRLEQRRTLADVARDARVSMPYLSEVERGRKEASSEVLAAVCDALGIELSDLLAQMGRDLVKDRAPVIRLGSVHQQAVYRQAAPQQHHLVPPTSGSGDVVLLAA